MNKVTGYKPVQLPGDMVQTTVENFTCQPKDAVVVDAHPYLNSFLEGFKEGFKFPFAMVFGIAGCSSHGSPLLDTKTIVYADCSADGGPHADGSDDVSTPEDVDVHSYDASADISEDVPTQTDAELDVGPDVTPDLVEDIAQDVTATQDAAEDVIPDTMTDAELDSGADVPVDVAEDATAADGVELPLDAVSIDTEDTIQDAGADLADDATAADGVELPPDAMSVNDTVVTEDATSPEDVTGTVGYWGLTPAGQPFCTSADVNTLLNPQDPSVFSAMCVYLDTVMTLVPTNGQPDIKTLPFTPEVFSINYNDIADVALKGSMTVYVKFAALLPANIDFKNTSVEPAFAKGASIALQLEPISLLTGEPNWKGGGISLTYHAADNANPAYVEMSYTKGVGLSAGFSFPCIYPKPYPPQDMLACPKKVAP